MAKPRKPKCSLGTFKVTYATMYDPPEELHEKYEVAVERTRAKFESAYPHFIGGRECRGLGVFEKRSPINTQWVLGTFQKCDRSDVDAAVMAAKSAFAHWSREPWRKRVAIMRKTAAIIEQRVYDIAATLSFEVGKNRMEALGDAQEAASLIEYYCDEMERNDGYTEHLPCDPIRGVVSSNVHLLKPYGVWAVIAPFNFPFALAGGPAGAALIAGNTVVFKPSTDTPLSGWLLTEAFRDAGVPDGVFNYVTGSGSVVGEGLIKHPHVAGITFTGSYDVGMHIIREFSGGSVPRPCIAEMGGKNATIITRNADIAQAVLGVKRSAFGLSGQKCSACSRVFVENKVFDAFMEKFIQETMDIPVGDPTLRAHWMGPVINQSAYRQYLDFTNELSEHAGIVCGGAVMKDGDLANGYFCKPTIAVARPGHRLWREEMFLPIVMVRPVSSLDEAILLANDSEYGLTAGFFGSPKESQTFFDRIESGVCYANRSMGATTGAWPGFQPFGGWKKSGSTGKNAGGPWYLPQYMHEQSQTRVSYPAKSPLLVLR